jgi:hypothetical protein
MLHFIEYTWFLWSILAVFLILRWFHVLTAGSELGEMMDETAEAARKPAPASGDQFPLSA